jgi:hypothetical protein
MSSLLHCSPINASWGYQIFSSISTFSDSLIHSCTLPLVGEYVDMIKAGIIDPVKVIRTALQDAARYNQNIRAVALFV